MPAATPPHPETLARRTTAGSAWLVASRLGIRGIDLVALLALARLLTPADFGLVAVAMTIVQVLEAVFDLPIVHGVIRAPRIDKPLLDTAFTLGLLRSIVLGLLLLALAPAAALAFGDARLAPLQAFLALSPVLRGLASPALACWGRALDFRREITAEVIGKCAGFGIALAVALLRRDYWGIAAGTVASPLVAVALSYQLAPYRPAWSLRHWPCFRSFLGWATLAQLLSALNWKLGRLVLGSAVPHAALGRFTMAEDLAAVPDQGLIKPVIRPLMAAFAQLHADRPRLARAYLHSLGLSVSLGLPIMLALALAAPSLVPLLLGAHWLAAAPLLSGFALAVALRFYAAPFTPLALALGRTDAITALNLAELALRLPAIILAAHSQGVAGVLTVQLALSAIMALATMAMARALLGFDLGIAAQLRAVARASAAGLAFALAWLLTAALAAAAPGWLAALALLLRLALSGVAYIAALGLMWLAAGRPHGPEARVLRLVRPLEAPARAAA